MPMTIAVRLMRAGEEEAVARMVQGLARDVGVSTVPKLDAAALAAHADLIDVTVAEEGALLGACLTLMTFSTWRAAKGLYVVDLFVDPAARNRQVGLALLRAAARLGREKGARFIKLEVDFRNEGAARFYERLGFVRHDEDRLFIIEEAGLDRL